MRVRASQRLTPRRALFVSRPQPHNLLHSKWITSWIVWINSVYGCVENAVRGVRFAGCAERGRGVENLAFHESLRPSRECHVCA